MVDLQRFYADENYHMLLMSLAIADTSAGISTLPSGYGGNGLKSLSFCAIAFGRAYMP